MNKVASIKFPKTMHCETGWNQPDDCQEIRASDSPARIINSQMCFDMGVIKPAPGWFRFGVTARYDGEHLYFDNVTLVDPKLAREAIDPPHSKFALEAWWLAIALLVVWFVGFLVGARNQ